MLQNNSNLASKFEGSYENLAEKFEVGRQSNNFKQNKEDFWNNYLGIPNLRMSPGVVCYYNFFMPQNRFVSALKGDIAFVNSNFDFDKSTDLDIYNYLKRDWYNFNEHFEHVLEENVGRHPYIFNIDWNYTNIEVLSRDFHGTDLGDRGIENGVLCNIQLPMLDRNSTKLDDVVKAADKCIDDLHETLKDSKRHKLFHRSGDSPQKRDAKLDLASFLDNNYNKAMLKANLSYVFDRSLGITKKNLKNKYASNKINKNLEDEFLDVVDPSRDGREYYHSQDINNLEAQFV